MRLSFPRSFLLGGVCGVLFGLAALSTLGMSLQQRGGGLHVTQSADGRTAYLWSIGSGGLDFIDQARAPRGKGERDDPAKSGADGNDDDRPRGKGDSGESEKGKGKGKGKEPGQKTAGIGIK